MTTGGKIVLYSIITVLNFFGLLIASQFMGGLGGGMVYISSQLAILLAPPHLKKRPEYEIQESSENVP